MRFYFYTQIMQKLNLGNSKMQRRNLKSKQVIIVCVMIISYHKIYLNFSFYFLLALQIIFFKFIFNVQLYYHKKKICNSYCIFYTWLLFCTSSYFNSVIEIVIFTAMINIKIINQCLTEKQISVFAF